MKQNEKVKWHGATGEEMWSEGRTVVSVTFTFCSTLFASRLALFLSRLLHF